MFTSEMAARNDDVTKADDVQKKLLLMNDTWLRGSKQVCGKTNVHLDTRGLGGGIEMWMRWLPNERYVRKPGGNLNRLKINIL